MNEEGAAGHMESAIQELTGCSVESLHTDISTRTGERIIAFTLKGRPQCREKG
ncbi:MAG: Na-translocating system protein MpsC family protein [Dehalococcoidia bacterium]